MSAYCQSCNKLRDSLHVKQSYLDSGTTFLMCQTCIDARFEPRYFIIVYGRSFGIDSVKQFITPKKRYYGDPIMASDLIR